MATTTALQQLYNIAAGYKEKTSDTEEINVGNVAEKVIGAIGGGGYDSFEVNTVAPQGLTIDTSATEFTERPE